MRAAAATEFLTTAVRKHFDTDVAAAITNDTDMFGAAARKVAAEANTAEDVDRLIAAVAEDTSDHTLDWLADGADAPAGWLYSHL